MHPLDCEPPGGEAIRDLRSGIASGCVLAMTGSPQCGNPADSANFFISSSCSGVSFSDDARNIGAPALVAILALLTKVALGANRAVNRKPLPSIMGARS